MMCEVYAKAAEEKAKKEEYFEHLRQDLPEVPNGFMEWMKHASVHGWPESPIYYRRKGNYAECYCSMCGGKYKIRTKRGESYEELFVKVYPMPKNKHKTICLKCNGHGIYQIYGNLKERNEKRSGYIIQLYREKDIVVRWFIMHKRYAPDKKTEEELIEAAREYFIAEKKAKLREYQLTSGITGRDFWSHHNLGGLYNISFPYTVIYPGSYKEISKSNYKYCYLEKYVNYKGSERKIKVNDYLEKYRCFPIVEILMKYQQYFLVENIESLNIKKNETNPIAAMGIKKERFKELIKETQLSTCKFRWLQWECANNTYLSSEMLIWLVRESVYPEAVRRMLENMTLKQVKNYVERERHGMSASGFIDIWEDYISMANQLGMDTSDEIVYRAKNVKIRHDELVEKLNNKDLDDEVESYLKKYPDINTNLASVKDKFSYVGEQYSIIVPDTIRDILAEGRKLHHCVANERYIGRIQKKTSYILFLRETVMPEAAYYTLEVEPNGNVKQRRAEFNRQPNSEEIIKFIKEWQEEIKKRLTKQDLELAEIAKETRYQEMEELRRNSPEFAETLESDFIGIVLSADFLVAAT